MNILAKTKNARKPAKKTTTKKSSLVSKSVSAVKTGASLLGIGADKKKSSGISKPKGAKTLLKRAYERKAKRLVRMGMLGQARRVLRKKATVI